MTTSSRKSSKALPLIGWREWLVLPDLGNVTVKAKIDTGAKTSAIHAWRITEEEVRNKLFVTFDLHPVQRSMRNAVTCRAPVVDRRVVRNSGGQQQARYVIETAVHVGDHVFDIELTLTQRDEMGFRMLLGRDAVKSRFLVNPARSFLLGKRRD
ncbi:MAG: ATP-dependent zinc protease family protein [Hyphomicrobiaceae bacterium]